MTFKTLTYTVPIGAIIGLIWSFAIKFSFTSGLLYGAIAGLILGLFLSYVQNSIVKRGNIKKEEAGFVTGSLMGIILLIGVGTGLISWLIRYIFF